jgi:hypothetical protein
LFFELSPSTQRLPGPVSVDDTPHPPAERHTPVDLQDALRLVPHTGQRLVILVRENELYLTTLDQVANLFRARGYTVEIASFPPGTSEEEVHEDLTAQLKAHAYRGCLLVTDRFVQRSWHMEQETLVQAGIIPAGTIDALLAEELLKITRRKFMIPHSPEEELRENGRETDPGQYLTQYGKCVSAVFRAALEGQGYRPSRIDIFAPYLVQHEPFVSVLWRNPLKSGLIQRQIAFSLFNGRPYPQALLTKISRRWNFEAKCPLATVSEWVVESGFPKNQIRLISSVSDLRAEDYAPGDNALLVMDRHLAQEDFRNNKPVLLEQLRKARFTQRQARSILAAVRSQVIIQLPLENALLDFLGAKLLADEQGLNEKDIVDVIYRALAKKVEAAEAS